MYEISIIIPIFNAEKFLENTIQSIIGQSIGFENIELILVDDCSKDQSAEIIQKYEKQYDNIKAIYLTSNSGAASYPRNVGIAKATGKYMMFLDSDDDIFEDYCEVLYKSIEANDVDIVNCNHSSRLNNKIYIPSSIEKITTDENKLDSYEKILLKHTAWGNIYKTSFIRNNNIEFPNTMYDDGVFSINCISKTKKPVIQLKDYPGYIYLIENEDSITHKTSLKTLIGFIDGYKLCEKILNEIPFENEKEKIFGSFVNMAIFILIKLDNLDEGINELYSFENMLGFDINLNSMPLQIINEKIMNKQFRRAKLYLKIMGLVYNNKKIRNFIFIKYSGLKPLRD